ncbi:hypothetical protein [Streptomyces sp. NPDC058612]|uniref:hypothetical protein n=1 Tax=Streptomyces sp. NPDC058612 TaxID=3346555 RepID=UPI00365CBBAB
MALKAGRPGPRTHGPPTKNQAHHHATLENLTLALGVAVFATAFCLTYAVINPLLQLENITRKEIERQWIDGTIVLRFTTIGFCSVILWRALYYLRCLAGPGGKRQQFQEESSGIDPYLDDDDRRLRDFCQSAFFIGALFILWLTYAKGVRTPEVAALAWVFAFFSDDWIITSDYSRVLKGRVLQSHRWRMTIANLLLLVLLNIVAWKQWEVVGVLFVNILLLPILAGRYEVDRRAD